MAREVKHENGCLPSILLFTSEAIRFFPLSSCPKHAKSPKRLPSFPQFRKKTIPFLYRLLYHAHLWPWQAWSWLSLYTSARTRPVRGCWLRSISLVWGSMLPPSPMTLRWRQTGYPLPSRCDNKHIHIHPQHLWLLWEVLLSCLVLEITDQFCKLRKHQKQSGGKKKPNYPSSSKIRLRHAFAARGKIAS